MRNALMVLAAAFVGALISGYINHPAEADAAPRWDGTGPEGTIMATGGSADNRTDLLWVLDRRKGKDGPELHLALYQADKNKGTLVARFSDARRIDWDMKIIQWTGAAPTVKQVKKLVEKAAQNQGDDDD